MTVRLSRSNDRQTVEALHMLTFPGDDFDLDGQLWVGHDDTKTPVAFCSARLVDDGGTAFLSRAGILPCARGAGLQRRLISVRCRWAREQGCEWVTTYVLYDNHASIANLIKSGFQFFHPHWKWAGDVHYLRRNP